MTYEAVKRFKEAINERFETGNLRVHVVIIPAPCRPIRSLLEAKVCFCLPKSTRSTSIIRCGTGGLACIFDRVVVRSTWWVSSASPTRRTM